jgi:hypothetical protein
MTEISLDPSVPVRDSDPSTPRVAMAKGTFLMAFYLSAAAGIVGLGASTVLLTSHRTQGVGLFALLVGVLGFVATAVTMAVFVYRIWSSLPAGYARTTPGAAVGRLFVPFYNLYWMFQALPGFATDYSRAAVAHGIDHRLGRGPFVAYAVLTLAAAIPVVGVVAALANLVVAGYVISAGCNAANRITAAPRTPLAGPAAPSAIAPVVDSPAPVRDGTKVLGAFALLLALQSAIHGILPWLAPEMDLLWAFRLTAVVFSPDILVMGLFVRPTGLKATVIAVGAVTCAWRLTGLLPQLLGT